MKYAYYPGCSAESTAREQDMSVRAVSDALGIELVDIDGWTCCGSTPAHHTDAALSVALPAANLIRAQEAGFAMVVSCAACYNRMKTANHAIRTNPRVREEVCDLLKEEYDGGVEVLHFVEVLRKDVGLKNLRSSFVRTLDGLNVASYYGCLLVRPHGVMQFDDPENPSGIDDLVEAMGGETVEWSDKTECCGGGMTLARTDIVVGLTGSILESAKLAGADCIAVACPMCQVNLDLRQADVNRERGRNYDIPVLYLTQLLGVCLGIEPRRLGLGKNIVSPDKILR